jgi:mannose-6-phosphate isomerase-like protein (cupin superfamily)
MKFSVSVDEARRQLYGEHEFPFTMVMQHGSMTIEYFEPDTVDTQTPHKKDEIYVIIKGRARFYRNGERVMCKRGDVLFVPAGMEHRFEKFSRDFATWVIFFGEDGGEES